MGQRMLLLLLAGSLVGCRPSVGASWAIYPLPHHAYHDELAVVNQPDGFGLHIWLETTQASWTLGTTLVSRCPLARSTATGAHRSARVGPPGRSSRGCGTPRPDVLRVLESELEAPCAARLRGAEGIWVVPPRSSEEAVTKSLPLLEGG